MLRSKYIFLLGVLVFIGFTLPRTSLAQEWHGYKSTSNLFTLRMPDNVQEEADDFRIDSRRVAQIGQAVSKIDQRPFKDTVKHYIVKYEQTLGLEITDQDIPDFISHELDLYSSHYGKLDGIQKSRSDLMYENGTPGGEIHIEYEDPQLGSQSIRARVFFTRSGKIQHIVSGPREIMDSMPTRRYLKSIITHEGYKQVVGSIMSDWKTVKSPLGVFTAYLPEKTMPYVPRDIDIKRSDSTERITIRFYDPIFKQTLFYNIYGYKVDKRLNYLNVQNLLREKHVLRHVFNDSAIEFDELTNNNLPVLQTAYGIEAPEEFPYVDTVRLRAKFSRNRIVVHEIMGSHKLAQSNFINHIVQHVEFHDRAQN